MPTPGSSRRWTRRSTGRRFPLTVFRRGALVDVVVELAELVV